MSQVTDFNPVCASSYTLKGKLTREKLRPIMELQAESFPRYRQRLADTGRKLHGARFEDSPDFDVDQHSAFALASLRRLDLLTPRTVRTIHLPGAAGKKELDAAMSRFLSEDWDLAKPLWDVLLVDKCAGSLWLVVICHLSNKQLHR